MGVNLNSNPQTPLVDQDRRITREWLAAFTQTDGWTLLVDLVTEVTGILRVVNGGTGRSSLTAHDVLVGNGTSAITAVSPSTAGLVLTSNGTSADPSFQAGSSGTVTHTGTLTAGKLIQGNGGADITVNATTATVTKLTAGTPSAASAGTDYVAPGAITTDGITMATARLLGRTTASTGAVEEISVGSGLTLSAGSLTATGTGGTVTTTGSPASGNLTKFSGATSVTNADLTGDVTTSGTVATTLAAGSASVLNSGTLLAARMPALTGDVTSTVGTVATTLAASGASAGTYGSATVAPVITVDAKGRITTVTTATITPGAGSGGALTLLEQHTASSSASLDFTTAITSTYDDYLIEFVSLIPATNTVAAQILVSTNGGASYSTSAIYDYAGNYASTAPASGAIGASSQAAFSLTGSANVSNTALGGLIGSFRLVNPLSAALHKSFMGQIWVGLTDGFSYNLTESCVYKSTTAVNAFQFKFSSGNIASGTIRVYGLAK